MQRTFTPFLWAYQNYGVKQQVNDLFAIDQVFEPCEFFEKILDELENKVPEIQEEVIKKILQKV